MRQRIFIFILSLRSNRDQMNALLLILHWIPISTPPSMECNSALIEAYFEIYNFEPNLLLSPNGTYMVKKNIYNVYLKYIHNYPKQILSHSLDKINIFNKCQRIICGGIFFYIIWDYRLPMYFLNITLALHAMLDHCKYTIWGNSSQLTLAVSR